jgi:methionyl-tRNA synthetase
MMNRNYITTPIYYVNAAPHLGHAHSTVMADILKRYRCMRGEDVFLSTGTDEHGQKNQEAAAKSGLSTKDYLDGQSGAFQRAFDQLGVAYDYFVRTTRPFHITGVQHVENILNDAGLLVRKPYRGMYCSGCEQFKREADLSPDGYCLEHPNLKAEETDENNYFLVMEPYRAQLIAHIEQNPDFVQPDQYRHELLAMLSQPLEDLCISRPKARLSLGVELPFDPEFVTYVWIDALVNYLTNVGYPNDGYQTRWGGVEHLIGKDILKTHGVFWPIILMAAGLPLPQRLSVHGHWLGAGGQKMSKSLGNVVDPFAVIETYGASALRWFLARHMRVASDSQISVDLIHATYNTELGNKLGNLLQRLLKFSSARFDGRLPSHAQFAPQDRAIRDQVLASIIESHREVELSGIPQMVATILQAVEVMNEYVTREAPWTLIKTESERPRVESIVYACLDGLRLALEALWPIMPVVANKGLEMMGAKPLTLTGDPATRLAGGAHRFVADGIVAGGPIGEIETLFPRVDVIPAE